MTPPNATISSAQTNTHSDWVKCGEVRLIEFDKPCPRSSFLGHCVLNTSDCAWTILKIERTPSSQPENPSWNIMNIILTWRGTKFVGFISNWLGTRRKSQKHMYRWNNTLLIVVPVDLQIRHYRDNVHHPKKNTDHQPARVCLLAAILKRMSFSDIK